MSDLIVVKQLSSLANKVQQLGSSVGALSSAYHLRHKLADIRHIFRKNAESLFPTIPPQGLGIIGHRRKKPRSWREKILHIQVEQTVPEEPLNLPRHLEEVATGLGNLLSRLNEFPEFHDENLNTNINVFKEDLNVCAGVVHHWATNPITG